MGVVPKNDNVSATLYEEIIENGICATGMVYYAIYPIPFSLVQSYLM